MTEPSLLSHSGALGQSLAPEAARTGETVKAASVAFVVGTILLFVVGFAPSQAVHNAAHDTRHTLSFPCH